MMIKIYYADITNLNIENNLMGISVYRNEKLNKIRPTLSKRQSLGAELILNSAVKEIFPDMSFPLNIKHGKFGKPFCPELPVFFSISHSGNFSACAICEEEIGLDIQKPSAYKENLVKHHFTKSEREYIENSVNKDKAFIKLWTMKESYIKAIGTGLHTTLESFSVWPEAAVNSDSLGTYGIWSDYIEDYSFSVCVTRRHCPTPIIRKIEL